MDALRPSGTEEEALDIRPRTGFRVGALGPVLMALPVAHAAVLLLVRSESLGVLLSNLFQAVAAALAAGVLWGATQATRRVSPSHARGWLLITASAGLFALGMAGFMFVEVVLKELPYPAFPDFFFILSYPVMIYGLLCLPATPLPGKERVNNGLDVLALGLVTLLVLWNFNLHRLIQNLNSAPNLASHFSLLYSLLDILLLFVLFTVLLGRLARGIPFQPILLLIGGCFCLIIADFGQAYITTYTDFTSGGVVDVGWVLYSSLCGLAGLCQYRQATAGDRPSAGDSIPRSLAIMGVTYVWIGVMLFLLLLGTFSPSGANPYLLTGGTLAVIALVVLRQVRNVLDNHRLAVELRAANQQLRAEVDRAAALNARLRASEAELIAAIDTKNKFFSIIGHDLKNPLNVILMLSETVALDPEGYDRQQLIQTVGDMNVTTRELNGLLDNLLTWARSQQGRIEFAPAELRLREIVESSLELNRQRIRLKQLRVEVDVGERLTAWADRDMLRTVLRNLLSNAVKFTGEGGWLAVQAHGGAEGLTVAVSDGGIGLSSGDVAKLFRLDVPNKTIGSSREKGTGLGLILCREFVERHGGRIWAESQLGRGSRFVFTLPRPVPGLTAALASSSAASSRADLSPVSVRAQ